MDGVYHLVLLASLYKERGGSSANTVGFVIPVIILEWCPQPGQMRRGTRWGILEWSAIIRGPLLQIKAKGNPLLKNIELVKRVKMDPIAQNINILKKIHKRLIQIEYNYKTI